MDAASSRELHSKLKAEYERHHEQKSRLWALLRPPDHEMSPTQTLEEDASLLSNFSMTINGELVKSESSLYVINPRTADVFARCPAATLQHLNTAVDAAKKAVPVWSSLSFAERRDYILKFTAAVRENQDSLEALLMLEQGKPLPQAREEITRALAQADAIIQIEIQPEILVDDEIRRVELHYVPQGVVGVISPWNAPVVLAIGPMVSALYTGNAVVLKPSPYTPLCTLRLGEIAKEVFPPGVVNVISGDNDIGQWMTEHANIDKISFTGSVATGKRVLASCSGTLKRFTLELGGNDAAIVLDDSNIREVAKKIAATAFVNAGQVCMAIKVVFVDEKIFDEFCDALVEEVLKLDIGPLQNRMQFDKICSLLEDLRNTNARILLGGNATGQGYFVEPTIVTDVSINSRIVREEQFGPILPIQRFRDPMEVIRWINNQRLALGGSIWSSNVQRATELAMHVNVGTVWVNQHRVTAANVPFGGMRESGIGRNYSSHGLKSNMEPKVINILK